MKNSGGPVKIDSSSFVNVVREKPPPFTLRRFLYNKKEGLYLGKTKSGWGKNGHLKIYKKMGEDNRN